MYNVALVLGIFYDRAIGSRGLRGASSVLCRHIHGTGTMVGYIFCIAWWGPIFLIMKRSWRQHGTTALYLYINGALPCPIGVATYQVVVDRICYSQSFLCLGL
jgi:hypothetical protein